MPQMSMNRAIHAAVRRDLVRFLEALGSFPDGDRTGADQLGRAWANFDGQLTHHHHGEHDITWPALLEIGVSPQLLEDMDSEHGLLATALTEAGDAMGRLEESASAADADSARDAVARLQEVVISHLDHEEAELEQVFLSFRKHPAIRATGRKHARQPPQRTGMFLAWLEDGAGADERAAIAEAVPPPVAAVMRSVFGRAYRKEIAPVWS